MAYADWVITGRDWETETPTIDGSPTGVTAAANGLYLVHPTASLSLLARLVVAMTSAGVGSPAAFVTEARYVRLTSSGTFTIAWGSATTLRDLLGFTGDLSGASSYTATNRSPLLWSPGKVLTPEQAPLDFHGAPVLDASVSVGPLGNIVVRQNGEPSYVNRYSGRHVARDRYGTSPNAVVGQWLYFLRTELWQAKRVIVLRRVLEGSSVTASADYATSVALGPYRLDLSQSDTRREFVARSEGFGRVEAYYDVTFPVVQTEEFS